MWSHKKPPYRNYSCKVGLDLKTASETRNVDPIKNVGLNGPWPDIKN